MPADRAAAGARALRIGVGGPVGTGKSSLIATLCRALAGELEIGVVTNDIYTDEDARFLRSEGVLPVERIEAVQTGCCPHTAIRDDISANLEAADELERRQGPLDVVFVESGGDNLTAAFSPALADTQIFVLDCAGGDDVPRKGGPGVERSDLLVINKVDLAGYVGASVEVMVRDATARRGARPVIALSLRSTELVVPLVDWVRAQLASWRARTLRSVDPGPPAPHGHHHEHAV
ncbi:MAG TPA: urease accessory protein UreG [Solirubrobacteraceae bacterium]|nr:urease accessory protein UreG [Solirubrobacteraceae bacterium]